MLWITSHQQPSEILIPVSISQEKRSLLNYYSSTLTNPLERERANLHVIVKMVNDCANMLLWYLSINLRQICVEFFEEGERNPCRTTFQICCQYLTNSLHGKCQTLKKKTTTTRKVLSN